MKTAKISKFDWSRVDDKHSGHTQYEWGEPEKRSKK